MSYLSIGTHFLSVLTKMALSRVLLMLVCLKITSSTSEQTCKKIDICSCKLTNGSTVSLHAVYGGSAGPSFTGIKQQGGFGRVFDWNPCTPFSTAMCSNVMVCQLGEGESYPAGSKDTSFSVNNDGNVVISYGGIASGSPVHIRGSKITLKCDPNQPGKGIIPKFTESCPSSTTSIYNATFTSKYACATEGDNFEVVF